MDTGEFMLAARIGQAPSEDSELDQREAWMIAEERLSVLRDDLRNRLSALRNASAYLKKKNEKSALWSEDDRVPHSFSVIEEELKKIESTLVHEVTVASLVARSVAPVSLRRCVERAVATLKSAAQVELVREMPPPSAMLPLCEVEVAVLARCLLRNAVEASPKGSAVQVRTKQSSDAVVLEIADQGKGFSPDWEARAFAPFTGTKMGQVGVGLNVARRLCQRYGAELQFRRPPAGGFVAEVRFPRQARESRAG